MLSSRLLPSTCLNPHNPHSPGAYLMHRKSPELARPAGWVSRAVVTWAMPDSGRRNASPFPSPLSLGGAPDRGWGWGALECPGPRLRSASSGHGTLAASPKAGHTTGPNALQQDCPASPHFPTCPERGSYGRERNLPASKPYDIMSVGLFAHRKGGQYGVVHAWALETKCLDPISALLLSSCVTLARLTTSLGCCDDYIR